MIRNLAKWAGYIGLGIIAYVMFLYWTFPFDQLKGRLEGAIEKSLGPDYDVRIAHISPSFITGVVMKGVSLSVRSGSTTQTIMDVDKAKLRVGLFSVIFGNPEASFSLQFKKSTIDGTVGKRDNAIRFKVDLDPLLMANVPWFATVLGLQLEGKIKGIISMTMSMDGKSPPEGSINLDFSGGELKQGSVIPVLGEAKNPIRFAVDGPSVFKAKWEKDNSISIEDWKWLGGDLQLDMKGQIFSATRRININGTANWSPTIENEYGFLKAVAKQRQADGRFAITLTGSFDKLNLSVGDQQVLRDGANAMSLKDLM